MILHIEDLWKSRNYKIDTFYLAVNIADHYLAQMARQYCISPCLVHLGTTALFIAAKIEQSQSPCSINLINLIKKKHQIKMEKKAIFDLESSILRELAFDIRFIPSLAFLERLERLFEVDKDDQFSKLIGDVARQLSRLMMISSNFLQFKPSQIAAAALLVSLKINITARKTPMTTEQKGKLTY